MYKSDAHMYSMCLRVFIHLSAGCAGEGGFAIRSHRILHGGRLHSAAEFDGDQRA